MGGFGSGMYYRWNTKIKIDECRSLDINRMIKLGAIPKCGSKCGSWIWSDKETGEEKSSISYYSNTVDKSNPYLQVRYTITSTNEKHDYKIKLARTRPNYGGERFWFLCPVKGIRTTKLYLPCGGDVYASRQAYGLKYATQSMCPASRTIEKKWRIVRKTDGYDFPVRPKGMHHKTFDKIMEEFWRVEEECDTYLTQFLMQKF